MRLLPLAALAALAIAGAASAQSSAMSLTLQNAASAPVDGAIIDGVRWRCDTAGACVGTGLGAEQPATRACRRAVAQLGPVSAFTWRGRTLSAEQVAACNTAA